MENDTIKNVKKRFKEDKMFLIFAIAFAIPAIVSLISFFVLNNRDSLGLVFLIVFPIADLMMWAVAFKYLYNNKMLNKILSRGTDYKATIIKVINPAQNSENSMRYSVQYKWIDEEGVEHEAYSKAVFLIEEAHKLLKLKIVNIKALGNNSVIINNLKYENNNKNSYAHKLEHHVAYQKRLKCNYCGKIISKNHKICPHCNSKIID